MAESFNQQHWQTHTHINTLTNKHIVVERFFLSRSYFDTELNECWPIKTKRQAFEALVLHISCYSTDILNYHLSSQFQLKECVRTIDSCE